MIVPDLNLLLYAYGANQREQAAAGRWWQECLSRPEPVLLAPVVVFGFLRLATLRIFPDPLSPDQATAVVRAWLVRPQVQLIEANSRTLEIAMSLLIAVGTAGNLVSDAEIAASALQHGAVVHTADSDFARFAGVRWLNPLRGTHGG